MNKDSIIKGEARCKEIYIDGFRLSPHKSQKVYDHSQEFFWGYLGSGPAQLALGLLLEAGVDNVKASEWHQEFKSDVIAKIPQKDFDIKAEVVYAWIENKERKANEG